MKTNHHVEHHTLNQGENSTEVITSVSYYIGVGEGGGGCTPV